MTRSFPYGLPDSLVVVVDKLKRNTLVLHQNSYCEDLLMEFYASVLSTTQNTIVFRGMNVPFSAMSINFHLRLTKDPLSIWEMIIKSWFQACCMSNKTWSSRFLLRKTHIGCAISI